MPHGVIYLVPFVNRPKDASSEVLVTSACGGQQVPLDGGTQIWKLKVVQEELNGLQVAGRCPLRDRVREGLFERG